MSVSVAAFLMGLLKEHMDERSKDTSKTANRWKRTFDEYEATLPPPEERTVEQWEELVVLTGERYYSMAAQSNTGAATSHISNLAKALNEYT